MDRMRAADKTGALALALVGALLAALAVLSVVMTLGSGDAGVGDLLLLALWVAGLLSFSAGCIIRARNHLSAWRGGGATGPIR